MMYLIFRDIIGDFMAYLILLMSVIRLLNISYCQLWGSHKTFETFSYFIILDVAEKVSGPSEE